MEFGIRINSHAYVKFIIDLNNGNIDVIGELIEDGIKVEQVGSVVWEDGE